MLPSRNGIAQNVHRAFLQIFLCRSRPAEKGECSAKKDQSNKSSPVICVCIVMARTVCFEAAATVGTGY